MLGMASFWYLPIVKMPTIPHFGWLMATHTLGKYFQISLKIMLILLHLAVINEMENGSLIVVALKDESVVVKDTKSGVERK